MRADCIETMHWALRCVGTSGGVEQMFKKCQNIYCLGLGKLKTVDFSQFSAQWTHTASNKILAFFDGLAVLPDMVCGHGTTVSSSVV
jgi:hypothetical protein